MNQVTLQVFYAYLYKFGDAEPIAVITRPNRRMCVAVAKAHYAGSTYHWHWLTPVEMAVRTSR